uniref:BTB domain-containing protein n=1 Tax=Branchiostoma floridae TaxID=7739 RepID=C3XUT4_BRAFL|eukprot:XP_002612150.1 hypothetical protein BRAFLDRAFT_88889 [Branchiostoma floridae]
MSISDPVVSLNVGGHIYTTARSTLTRYRDSMLGAMFGGDFDTAARDDQGRYFIDRNGRLFEHVLNFLRTTQLVLPEDFKELRLLEMEADFYQIQPLIEALKTHKARLETGPCDVVVLSHRHNPYHPFSVAASNSRVVQTRTGENKMSKPDSVVSLNVGGHIYTTARSTLTQYRDSMLGAMFGGDFDALRDDQGSYFIDRNGRLFEHVLNFLRTTQLVLPEDFKELPLLEIEADFYQIKPLLEALKNYKARLENKRCEVVVLSASGTELSIAASSSDVKDVVNGLETCNPYRYDDNEMAGLLGRLQDKGFTVQSHFTFRKEITHNALTEKWVLVRKTARKSLDSK